MTRPLALTTRTLALLTALALQTTAFHSPEPIGVSQSRNLAGAPSPYFAARMP